MFRSVEIGTNQKRQESRVYFSGDDINDPGRTRRMRQREKNGVADKGKAGKQRAEDNKSETKGA